jgi:excisionase family DNA binding protein
MATPARTVEELAEQLDRVERLLLDLVRERGASRAANAPPLSKREAARRLGIDRGTTLEDLIREQKLQTVPALNGKGVRIPAHEVERLLREGLPGVAASTPAVAGSTPARRSPTRGRQKPAGAAETARAIRSIPIPRPDDE